MNMKNFILGGKKIGKKVFLAGIKEKLIIINGAVLVMV